MSSFFWPLRAGRAELLDQVRQLVRLRHVISFIESFRGRGLFRETAVLPQSDYSRWPLPSSPPLSLARKGIRGT